jgi:alpha-1,2-mannosyltransferase
VWLCMLPAAHSLMRGQTNLVVLLLFTGMIVSDIQGRKLRAGIFLALAISIKVIPAFLLIYPLWRRDWRFLGGCAAGLVVTLALLPGVVLGPRRTAESYVELANAVLRPGLTHQSEDSTRAKELTNITGTDNQSFVAIVHYTLYPDPQTRPDQVAPSLRLIVMTVGGLVTLLTLLAAPRRSQPAKGHSAAAGVVAWGAMLLVMLFCSPMSHSHYYCWCVPLLMGLLALRPPRGSAWLGWMVLGTVFAAGMFLPHPPVTAFLRDFGVVTFAGLMMWCVAVAVLTWETRINGEAAGG